MTRRLRRGSGFTALWGSRQLRCPKVSKGRAESPLVRPQVQAFCRWGLTRRLRRGSRACRPMGRSHFSFVGERKVCKRKPAARRLRKKALYCPFLKEGVRNVARRPVSEITHTFVRARAHSFPLSKRARLFPSAAYRRPRPRGWHEADSNFAGWEIAVFLMYLCNAKREAVYFPVVGCEHTEAVYFPAVGCEHTQMVAGWGA